MTKTIELKVRVTFEEDGRLSGEPEGTDVSTVARLAIRPNFETIDSGIRLLNVDVKEETGTFEIDLHE